MNTSLLFKASAIAEVLTGLAFLVAPTLIVGWLLGEGVGPTGIAVARVLGVALLSVGIAAWESRGKDDRLAPRAGLCIYNVGVAVLLAILATAGSMYAPLLWPVVVLHGLIGALMLWAISAYFRNNNKI